MSLTIDYGNLMHRAMRGLIQQVLTDVRLRFYEALVAQRQVELSRQVAELGQRAGLHHPAAAADAQPI